MDAEILEGFREEANQILKELAPVVEALEEAASVFPADRLTEFAQKIDRIMGAAKTLGMLNPDHQGLKRIGLITEICKALGYKASEIKRSEVLPLFAAFWADTLDVVSELIDVLEDEVKSAAIADRFSLVLQKRLKWLSEKLAAFESTATAAKGSEQIDVDALLKELGV